MRSCGRSSLGLLVAGLAGLAALPCAHGGDEPSPAADLLRAELQPARPVYTSDMPVRLRFTLVNTGDRPVEIPLPTPWNFDDGLALPPALLHGQADRPALTLVFNGEAPQAVRTSPAGSAELSAPASGGAALRIAAHSSLGTEVDLRDFYPAVRYPGAYRVEWQPLGPDGPVGAAEFRVEPRKDAILVTDFGKITFTLEYELAPRNVENFLELVRADFYSGKTLHRIVPGFVLQGGCPNGNGTGMRKDGKTVVAEFHNTPVDLGTLMMARRPSDPNSASCQFLIALGRQPALDGKYTVIGRANDPESLRTLQALAAVRTDRNDRPLAPVTIRSINLVDADSERVRNLGHRSPAPSTPSGEPARSAR